MVVSLLYMIQCMLFQGEKKQPSIKKYKLSPPLKYWLFAAQTLIGKAILFCL